MNDSGQKAELATKQIEFANRINNPGTDATRGGHHKEWQAPVIPIASDLFSQQINAHAPFFVCVDPADAVGAEATDIDGFLDPGVRFG